MNHLVYFRKAPFVLAFASLLISPGAALADVISPHIGASEHQYSEEKPDSQYYGTGVAGRMTEASVLRLQGERDTEDDKLDEAIRQLGKAIQLDPGDPQGHLLYARALSKKIKSAKTVTPELVYSALTEWRMLWHYDVDFVEQFEAHMEVRRLTRVAKVLAKDLKKRGHNQDSLVAQKADDQN